MNCKWLLALSLWLFSLHAKGQTLLQGDYLKAVSLNVNQKYTFKNSAVGFGREQEFPQKKTHNTNFYEKERNTCWFSLTIPADGYLTFEITPFQSQDDYDWLLFKETSANANEQTIDYNHPVRSNNSRNDPSINGKTGLKDGFNDLFTPPGPGKSYSKPIAVRKGENYILLIDNIYPDGKGFTFFSEVKSRLPSQIPPQTVSGIISDKESMQPLKANLIAEDSAGRMLANTVSDSLTGKYSFRIPTGIHATVSILKKGYVLLNDFIPAEANGNQQNYLLQKLKQGGRINFYNIRFLPNSPAIVNTSSPDLQRLLAFLQDEKDIRIQVIGHTNANVFTDAHYLQRLSEKRALAIKNYLYQHGIAPDRIQCVGKGGENPLYDNKKPEEAVKNLRVEIVVEK